MELKDVELKDVELKDVEVSHTKCCIIHVHVGLQGCMDT